MNIEEFEEWVTRFRADFVLIDEEKYDGGLSVLIEYLSSKGYYNTVRLLKEEIKGELNNVKPIEDRDFLMLKYSQILS